LFETARVLAATSRKEAGSRDGGLKYTAQSSSGWCLLLCVLLLLLQLV